MMFYLIDTPVDRHRSRESSDPFRRRHVSTGGCMRSSLERNESAAIVRRNHWRPLACVVVAMLAVGTVVPASAQTPTTAYLDAPPAQPSAKPMSPARMAWMKGRCSQLVAFFDYYGVSRGENSDGPRNHTRIGAVIECERTHFRTGVKTMEALLKRKAFDVPTPGTPEVEPEDIEAPDISRPIGQRY
ncbi:MAG: hypothetical protein ACXWLB_02740 [Reyranella sp.]